MLRHPGPSPLTLVPIGVARTPFLERSAAPRQPAAAVDVPGRIELTPGRDFEHALGDVDRWSHLWVLFWFHLNEGWRPKVLPPRSERRRGVFSTRSPYRPNPLGLSVLRLERVEGLTLHVRDVDMLDGTPVLDIKPYVAYADARPEANAGWLLEPLAAGAAPDDPAPGYEIAWAEPAATQAAWLLETQGVDVRGPATRVLALGPQPHPYRRIRAEGDRLRLALKDWRVYFSCEGRHVTVHTIATGYRERELWGDTGAPAPHRAFAERFGTAPRGR